MNKNIETRIYLEVGYILQKNCTIRETATIFNVSKSTVHKDLKERLKKLDLSKHSEIIKLFKQHIENRHINGGEATKKRYLKIKEG